MPTRANMELLLIKKPENLVFCEVEIWFNAYPYAKLEIDLDHINLGKIQTRKACLSLEKIGEMQLA